MKYLINEGSQNGAITVPNAFDWREEGSFVVFYDTEQNKIFALPTNKVLRIKQATE